MNVTELAAEYHADPSKIPSPDDPLPDETGNGNPVELLERQANAIIGHLTASLFREIEETLAAHGAVLPLMRVTPTFSFASTPQVGAAYEPMSLDELRGIPEDDFRTAQREMYEMLIATSHELANSDHADAIARLDRIVDRLLDMRAAEPERLRDLSRWERGVKGRPLAYGLDYLRMKMGAGEDFGTDTTNETQSAALNRLFIADVGMTWAEAAKTMAASAGLTVRQANLPSAVMTALGNRLAKNIADLERRDKNGLDPSNLNVNADLSRVNLLPLELLEVLIYISGTDETPGEWIVDPDGRTIADLLAAHKTAGRGGGCPAAIKADPDRDPFVRAMFRMTLQLNTVRWQRILPERRWENPPVDIHELQDVGQVELERIGGIRVIVRDAEDTVSSIDTPDAIADALEIEIHDGVLRVTQVAPIDLDALDDGEAEIVVKIKRLIGVTARKVSDLTIEGNCNIDVEVPPGGVLRSFIQPRKAIGEHLPSTATGEDMDAEAAKPIHRRSVHVVAAPGAVALLTVPVGALDEMDVDSQESGSMKASVGIVAADDADSIGSDLRSVAEGAGPAAGSVRLRGEIQIAYRSWEEDPRWFGLERLAAQVRELFLGHGAAVRAGNLETSEQPVRELLSAASVGATDRLSAGRMGLDRLER